MVFVPLHTYSYYSYLRSGFRLENYVKACKDFGFDYIGISEYMTLTSSPVFVNYCKANGIKPIIGEDLEIDGILFSFYVINENGYRSLCNLSFLVKNGKINLSNFKEHISDLVVITDITQDIFKTRFNEDEKEFTSYLFKLSKDITHFYVGINDDGSDRDYLAKIREFLENHSYDVVAFPFIKYQKREDALVLKMVTAIREDEKLEEKSALGNNILLNEKQIGHYYTTKEIEATREIANMVDFNINQKRGKMIHFQNELGLTSEEYLRKICFDTLKERSIDDEAHKERANMELDVICSMGFADYFLIVGDYVRYAKENNIPVGPGRGSASGSLVAYLLSIVVTDPLDYDLFFERFLNKERVTMPDIDVDFSDLKQKDVFKYIKEKYGFDKTSHIITTQRFGARQSLIDVGRIFNYPEDEIKLFTNLLPEGTNRNITLREAYKKIPSFKKLVDADKYYLEIVSLASKLEGFPRQSGVHPAGIVIDDEALMNVVPLTYDKNDQIIAEFEAPYLEEQGFLKMDILSISNLSVVENCLEKINRNGVVLRIDDIPFDDKEALNVINKGNTTGIFQLGSSGMRNAISIIGIDSFNDLVALLALYRPGPMQEIKTYGDRKRGLEKITYLDPSLEPILKGTYGVIIYQEQIMKIVSKFAGLSLARADIFRKAISKKDESKLASLKKEFMDGAINNGHDEKTSLAVFNLIYKFADYGFNKAHSVSYAAFAVRMAYLKAHYPMEFYTSILDNDDKSFFLAINEIKQRGINIKNPDINKSTLNFIYDDSSVIFPLNRIKGLFNEVNRGIIIEREQKGPYKDLFDFVTRMKKYKINAKQIMTLIDAGALDSLYPSRASLRNNISNAIIYADMVSDETGDMVIDMSSFSKPRFLDIQDDYLDNLNKEKEVLGLMLSGSPLKAYTDEIKDIEHTNIKDVSKVFGSVTIIGIVSNIKETVIKRGEQKGKRMCFLGVYDDTDKIDVTVFSDLYEESFDILKKNNVLVIKGRYQKEKNSIVANEINKIGE